MFWLLVFILILFLIVGGGIIGILLAGIGLLLLSYFIPGSKRGYDSLPVEEDKPIKIEITASLYETENNVRRRIGIYEQDSE